MEFFIYLLAGFALLILLISLLPVKLRISYGRKGERDLLIVEAVLWPGIKYSYRVVMIDLKSSLEGALIRYWAGAKKDGDMPVKVKKIRLSAIRYYIRQLSFWLDVAETLKPAARYIMSRTAMCDLKWRTVFGFNDPYYTGMTSGLIWSLKGTVLSFVYNRIKPSSPPALSVVPIFGKTGLVITFNCIFITKAGHIIFTGVRALAILILSGKALKTIKMARKASRRDRYGRTSDRGINENSHGKH